MKPWSAPRTAANYQPLSADDLAARGATELLELREQVLVAAQAVDVVVRRAKANGTLSHYLIWRNRVVTADLFAVDSELYLRGMGSWFMEAA